MDIQAIFFVKGNVIDFPREVLQIVNHQQNVLFRTVNVEFKPLLSEDNTIVYTAMITARGGI